MSRMIRPAHVPVPRRPGAVHRPAEVDTVVVGGGVVGAAAAWQLARRGTEVLLLERFGPGHTHGASHGTSRIYRQTYAAASYVDLAIEAYGLWRRLEEETGAAVLQLTGGVDHGAPRRTAELAAALSWHGITHTWLDPDEASARWPGMVFDRRVLFQPDRSGRLHADQSVAALTAAAVGYGADVRHNTPVERITPLSADRVDVDIPGRTIRARNVIVAVGAWTAGLVGDLVDLPPLRVTQEQPAHFPLRGSDPCRPDDAAWPTFIHHTGPSDGWPSGVYGLPAPALGVKLGFHGTGPACDPDRRTFTPEPAQLRRLQDYVEAFLPGLDHQHPDPVSCTYTSTPDSAFFVHATGPVVVAAGLSGHGFKFAPALGRVLADLAAGELAASPLTGEAAVRRDQLPHPERSEQDLARHVEPLRRGDHLVHDQPARPAAEQQLTRRREHI